MDIDTFLITLHVHVDDWCKADGAAGMRRRHFSRMGLPSGGAEKTAALYSPYHPTQKQKAGR